MTLEHWLLHITGTDTQDGFWYMLWSGFVPGICGVICAAAVLGTAVTYIRQHNCHIKGCWKLGHIDPVNHHPACKTHHTKIGETNNA